MPCAVVDWVGPAANEGVGSGVATIEGGTAIFKPDGAGEECRITPRSAGSNFLQKSFGQETEVRLGLTSVRGFVRAKLDTHNPETKLATVPILKKNHL